MNVFFIVLGFLLLSVGSVWFSRSLVASVGAVLLVTILQTWLIELPAVSFGLQLYAQDFLFVALLMAAVGRYAGGAGISLVPVAWYVFGLLVLLSFVLGTLKYGTAAGVDFRNYFYFWVGAFYTLSFVPSERLLQSVMQVWIAASFVIAGIVAYRWAVDMLHLPLPRPWVDADTTGVRFRVIDSSQAYVLGVAAVMVFFRQVVGTASKTSWLLLVMFVVTVVGLQHRSVWVMTFISLFSILFIPGVRIGRLLNKFAFGGGVLAVLLLPLMFYGAADAILDSVVHSAERATNLKGDTSGARIAGWLQLLDHWTRSGPLHQLLGEPFGGGYGDSERAPHNYYIQTLFRIGVSGLLALVTVYLGVLLRLRGVCAGRAHDYAPLFTMLLLGQMFFYIPYSPGFQHGLLLGAALAIARRPVEREKSEQHDPSADAVPDALPVGGWSLISRRSS